MKKHRKWRAHATGHFSSERVRSVSKRIATHVCSRIFRIGLFGSQQAEREGQRTKLGEFQVWRAAQETMAMYDGDAEMIAAGHAETCAELGMTDAMKHWEEVANVIRKRRRSLS